jgi:hypothetical protein
MTPDEIEAQARQLATTFIARKDVKAVQYPGGYTPEHSKWTMDDLRAHVAGRKSFGHYFLSQDNTCKLFAFDIDLDKTGRWLELNMDAKTEDEMVLTHHDMNPREVWSPLEDIRGREGQASVYYTGVLLQIARLLAMEVRSLLGIPTAIAYSGNKGLHVYGYTGEVQASEARDAALAVLAEKGRFKASRGNVFFKSSDVDFECVTIEAFPKQVSLDGKDLGNLMRLPLGKHLKSGNPAFFIDTTAQGAIIRPDGDPVTAMTKGNVL